MIFIRNQNKYYEIRTGEAQIVNQEVKFMFAWEPAQPDSWYGAAPVPLLGVLCPNVNSCTLPCFDTLSLLSPSHPHHPVCCEDTGTHCITSGGPDEEASLLESHRGSAGLHKTGNETNCLFLFVYPKVSFAGNIECQCLITFGLFTSCKMQLTNTLEKQVESAPLPHSSHTDGDQDISCTSWLTHKHILHEWIHVHAHRDPSFWKQMCILLHKGLNNSLHQDALG